MLLVGGPAPAVVDLSGKLIASLGAPTEVTWADDSKHLCRLGGVPGRYDQLLLIDAVQPQVMIATAPLPQIVNDQALIQLLSCSTASMIAVVAYRANVVAPMGGVPYATERLVGISFKTRATEFDWDLKSSGVTGANAVVVSHDSRYVALNGADGSLIRDSASGTVVAELPGYTVFLFSWTSKLVAAEALTGRRGTVMTWSPQHVLWSGSSVLVGALARPDVNDDMLAAIDNGSGGGEDLFIVHRDGTMTVAARNVGLILY